MRIGEKSDIHIGGHQTKLIGSQDGGIIGQDVAAGGGALAETEIIAAAQAAIDLHRHCVGIENPKCNLLRHVHLEPDVADCDLGWRQVRPLVTEKLNGQNQTLLAAARRKQRDPVIVVSRRRFIGPLRGRSFRGT